MRGGGLGWVGGRVRGWGQAEEGWVVGGQLVDLLDLLRDRTVIDLLQLLALLT